MRRSVSCVLFTLLIGIWAIGQQKPSAALPKVSAIYIHRGDLELRRSTTALSACNTNASRAIRPPVWFFRENVDRLYLEGTKMSDEWISHGLSGRVENIVRFLPGGSYYNVENTRTGEWRELWVGEDQDIGDAIAEGQWADDYDDGEDESSAGDE